MYVCLCLAVTSSTVQQVIDNGARSTEQVASTCGAGSICGRCRHTIRTMLDAAAPDPAPRRPDRLRRRWGRAPG
jgi:bacterioferritin-associated ferredoxin